MTPHERRWRILLVILASGCASVESRMRVASAQEAMCKYCNCLMPSGVDPQATCPVCQCTHKAAQCVRGH